MKNCYIGFVCALSFPAIIWGQMDLNTSFLDPQTLMMQHDEQRMNQSKSDDDKLETIQAYYIKEMLLKHVFAETENLFNDPEDEEDSMTAGLGKDFQNEMLIQAYADLLAKRDILKFKKLMGIQEQTY